MMNGNTRARRLPFALVLICALILSACGAAGQASPRLSGANQAPTIASTLAAPNSQAGIPATGNGPGVTVNDQASDGSTVMIAKVISNGPGWIAIHADRDGQIGPVIGYSPVKDGENDNVSVQIDPAQFTPTLYAMLHVDGGVVGKYEYPGPDVPYIANGQMVAPAFKVSKGAAAALTPAVTIHDQDASGGKVIVDSVVSNGPGWVDIHVQNPDGTLGKEIGYTAVHSGANQNVQVIIDASKITPTMVAALHVDAGTPGVFENPGADTTVMLNGKIVGAPFSGTGAGQAVAGSPTQGANSPTAMPVTGNAPGASPLPNQPTAVSTQAAGMVMATPSSGRNPSVKVSDQDVHNGAVKVDDVFSVGPGWIVIYTVNNGQPDQAIGYTHVNDGDNPNVIVTIDTTKPLDTLYAQLQIDAGTIGKYEFPGPDAPVMMGVQMISGLFRTNTNAVANASTPTAAPAVPSISIEDQPIHSGTVIVSHVVAVGESWVVIHPQNPDGTLGDYIGATRVHDGATDKVIVHIDVKRATKLMWAMLHVNASNAVVPQFPGVDVPVMVGGQMVLPPFHVTGPLTGDVPLTVGKNAAGVAYLADGIGMSLYLSLNDQPGKSNCTGDCLKQWQPLQASGNITAGNGVSLDKVGVITLPDRTRQITYAGAPVYYYSGDQNPGDTKGQGLDGNWFLVTP